MSDTARSLIESLLMIGFLTAAIVCYAVVAGRREKETRDANGK